MSSTCPSVGRMHTQMHFHKVSQFKAVKAVAEAWIMDFVCLTVCTCVCALKSQHQSVEILYRLWCWQLQLFSFQNTDTQTKSSRQNRLEIQCKVDTRHTLMLRWKNQTEWQLVWICVSIEFFYVWLKCNFAHKLWMQWHKHTHNRFTALLDFVRDYPGELAPER